MSRTVEALDGRAMGTTVRVVVVEGPLGLARDALAHVRRLEDRWSRFLPRSDIARLNRTPGAWVDVHPDTVHAVATACDAWRRTAGRFDPTVHDAIVALGYDRTFDDLVAAPVPAADPAPAPGPVGIELDVDGARVRTPPGVRLDLGGIGKGLAADLVAEAVLAAGAAGVLVDVGGDLRAGGASPQGRGWAVEVEHPLETARTAITLHFGDGGDVGVATSSTLGRRWSRADGEVAHHLLDARRGTSLVGPYVSATVVATRAWLADVACKVVLAGDPWPAALGAELPALAFDATGAAVELGGIDAWCAPGGGCRS